MTRNIATFIMDPGFPALRVQTAAVVPALASSQQERKAVN